MYIYVYICIYIYIYILYRYVWMYGFSLFIPFGILLSGVGVAMRTLNLLISMLCYTIGASCPETQCQDMVGCCDVTACCVSGAWPFWFAGVHRVV